MKWINIAKPWINLKAAKYVNKSTDLVYSLASKAVGDEKNK